MKLLALEKPLAAAPAFTPDILEREARALWALQQRGVVREAWFRADRHDVVLVLESGSIDEVRASLATLPLVSEHLIDFEIIALTPYDGYARLFRSD